MRKNSNLKRKIFAATLGLTMVLSSATIAFASESYTYPEGYTMTYDLYSATVSGKGGAGAYTETEDDAIAYVAIFSYKNGTIKNSGYKQQDCYVTLTITSEGGNSFKSVHSLKYSDNTPIGISKKLVK